MVIFSLSILKKNKDKIPDQLSTIENPVKDVANSDFKKFVTSLDERAFFYITLDEEKSKDIIISQKAFKIPDPSLLLVLKVKDQKAFQVLENYLTNARKTEEKGKLKLTFKYPKSPFTFNPVIQQNGNLLLIASNSSIIREFEKLQKGEIKSLADSDVIRKLSKNIPDKACSFFYMSPELMPLLHRMFKANLKTLIENQEGSLENERSKHFIDAGIELVNIHTPLKEKSFIFSTIEQKHNGLMFYSNSTEPISGGADFFDICSIGPSLTSLSLGHELFYSSVSEEEDNENSCRKNLNKIKKALDRYALDNKGEYPKQNGILGFGELIKKKYLLDINAIKCPDNTSPFKPIQFPLEENMCDYIYFGSLKDTYNQNIPLVFDKPGKNGHIRILFISGKISVLKQNAANCQELIRFLNLNFRYSEKIYNISTILPKDMIRLYQKR